MKKQLYDYDLFPMVFPAGQSVDFSIKPLGAHVLFHGSYQVTIRRFDRQGYLKNMDETVPCVLSDDGCIRFSYQAESECEHAVFLRRPDRHDTIETFHIYALDADLACRYPLRGELHTHTCRSDGAESPACICANYRKIGYDFIVVTDHQLYMHPS
ncbi:MAG: hypothetical protein IJC98_08940 [Clostridia bacterium]|nr:hypothetical protein [Clostridia bacterium]